MWGILTVITNISLSMSSMNAIHILPKKWLDKIILDFAFYTEICITRNATEDESVSRIVQESSLVTVVEDIGESDNEQQASANNRYLCAVQFFTSNLFNEISTVIFLLTKVL